jgi:GcrA cell cycle regulator
MNPGWTEPRVELLRTLWAQGLSASLIARQLGGVTRNAVIGKASRIGLAPHRDGIIRANAAAAARTRRAARAKEKAAGAPPEPRPFHVAPSQPPALTCGPIELPAEAPGLADVVSIARHQCKWPIGSPGEAGFTFCGQVAARGAFCASHAALAYKAPKTPGGKALEKSLRRYI